jgi:hypothetical protein
MAMGILGQLVTTSSSNVPELVYTVPAGKVAVFNIFATSSNSNPAGYVYINNIAISTVVKISSNYTNSTNINAEANTEIKSVIGNAGTIVQFQDCSGIVTGYEEDA